MKNSFISYLITLNLHFDICWVYLRAFFRVSDHKYHTYSLIATIMHIHLYIIVLYIPAAITVRIPAGIAKPKFIFPFSSIVATIPITNPVMPHTI